MRATAVVKILTQNSKVDPKQIIAAGRSEYLPISLDKTAEGRQMNRRTEIILTPKLDELLEIIEMN
jgi:chemotaxis protein MotB